MIINGMDDFQSICKQKLVNWYNNVMERGKIKPITLDDTYIVWSCKALKNYKCLASTSIDGDGVYAEYTYNGDKYELYEDVYSKITNVAYTK